jgi:hypothetical protein
MPLSAPADVMMAIGIDLSGDIRSGTERILPPNKRLQSAVWIPLEILFLN